MTSDAQLKKNKRNKLDPRAHIGYLVGYDSTNIYRIWIPHKGKVISTRDVIFDETKVFDGNYTDRSDDLIAELDTVIQKIELPDSQAFNEAILKEDEEILEPTHLDSDESDESDDEPVTNLNENEDPELSKALEEAYLTPPPSEEDRNSPCAFHVQFPVDVPDVEEVQEAPTSLDEELRDAYNMAQEERFADFNAEKLTSPYHGAFVAGTRFKDPKMHKRNLPPLPESNRDLETHPLREQFKEAQREHLRSHEQMKSFHETDKTHAKGQRILSSMWVFVYKTDKHGFLRKCKARLVVCGNQQARGDLPTRATTLASTAFRTLMAITAKFDLETIQMDAVNAFVHCDLDEVVYMKMPPGFTKQGKVLRL